ncbi:topoisomerase IV [Glaciecola sp. XM2]|jgi:hypothetical protein|uniref:porin n=1 Tax=Glaciecola sp. XM2 TaxID=1914931 RepID=UPI001BDE1A1F|nr:porin [Glaciecola sp. XM2]MBT1450137.1 topoisomerase IV [Glaciecola sp. XM2]
MKKLTTSLSVLAASMMLIGQAQADLRINGFANFTGGITSSDDTLYGFTDRVSFADQSLFAVQVSGDINDKMTATGQIIARGANDFNADFEWAYISYQATDDTSVSAGRLRMPLFRYSASLDVGYSYHWIAAPQSIYNVPYNNIDGIRVDHSGYTGGWDYNFQAAFGRIDNDFVLAGQPGQLAIDNVIVVNGELGYENWKFRGVYAAGKTNFDLPALDPAFAQLGQISPELSDKLAASDDTGTFVGASIEYDAFSWFVAAEYTAIEIADSFYPDEANYYVTAGIRTGKWTPHITYEKSDLNDGPKFLDEVANFPAPFQLPVTQLLVGIQQPAASEDTTITVGVRYDYDTNIAVKVEATQQTNDITDDDATLLRFAVNYIF